MKKTALYFVLSLFLFACANTDLGKKIEANTSTTMKISGMTCEEMCAKRIEDKIARMEGIKSCEVNFENELATFIYDEKKVNLDKLILNVEDMSDGKYTVTNVETEKIINTSTEVNSDGGSETGKIMTDPSFELPNLADYFRNIL